MDPQFRNVSSIEALNSLFERSFTEPVVLFKHSNSCGTSAYALEIMSEVDAEIHMVIVQENREVSNAVADRTGIRHQTPQALVLINGEVVYSASHYSIAPEAVTGFVSSRR